MTPEHIDKQFFGHARAIRRKEDKPYPGEPYMSMADAKEITRRLVHEAYEDAARLVRAQPFTVADEHEVWLATTVRDACANAIESRAKETA
jgi:hypothetical protein